MSEFLQRLEEHFKARNQAKRRASQVKALGSQKTLGGDPVCPENLLTHLFKSIGLAPLKTRQLSTSITGAALNPSFYANSLCYLLIILTAVSLTYWVMRIAQIPGTPVQPASGISRGSTLYGNQDSATAYDLFGSKPLITENIYLRGVVITSKGKDGYLDGFAIFEIDGKPTNAISVGENIGKGLSLQSIGDESATLIYQGQKLDFKLSKSGKRETVAPIRNRYIQ